MDKNISVLGVPEVQKALKALSGFPEQRQLIQAANRRAARPYISKAKSNVKSVIETTPNSKSKGDLVRSIGTKSAKRSNTIIVGPRESKKWRGFTGRFLEEGTEERFTRKTSAARGKITAKRPLAKAWAQSAGTFLELQIFHISALWDKYADKAIRR